MKTPPLHPGPLRRVALALCVTATVACGADDTPTDPGAEDDQDSSGRFCNVPSADLGSILGPEQTPP